MKDDLRYNPSDCFDTFPRIVGLETTHRVSTAGHEYYEFRSNVMKSNNEGLTSTYNRFHDPHEKSSEIVLLR